MKTINFRQATANDISKIQEVRISVIENVLLNPSKVTDEIVADYLTNRGKGWVCEKGNIIAGFAIVDLKEDNVWALFVKPEFEDQKIGKQLHNLMLDWYFAQGKKRIWLSTEPNTRAADFYRRLGWKEAGTSGKNEIRFEMMVEDWGPDSADG